MLLIIGIFIANYFLLLANKTLFSFQDLLTQYVFFLLLSIFVLCAVQFTSIKSFDNTGMVFMIITFIKVGIVYLNFRSIINDNELFIQKINIFFLFIFFLTLESFYTIFLLNKKR
jgi:hypothetical protein